MKKFKLKTSVIIFIAFLFGMLFSSFFWQYKFKDTKSSIEYKNFEIKNLEDQIATFRTDREKSQDLTPIPTPIPYVKKENLSSENIYKLDCYNEEEIKKNPLDWITKTKSLIKQVDFMYLCYNEELKKAAIIVKREGMTVTSGPQVYKFEFYVYDIQSNMAALSDQSSGNYLGGWCNKITAWTKSGSIYYECGGGDGPWGSTETFRLNISNDLANDLQRKGIAESCYTMLDKTSCSTYCQTSSDCHLGYICNLERNNCVQTCKTDNNCPSSACKPLGSVLACR